MGNRAVGAVFAGAAAVLLASQTEAAPRRVATRQVAATAGQLFDYADQLARRGNRDRAQAILSLLSHDRNTDIRNEARFRRAKLLQADGLNTEAAVILRQILDDRPTAAPVRLELAQLLDKMGDKDGAWRQVRAAQSAGLPSAVAKIVDRYSQALRAARPSGASFEIALAPDSNINHATRSDTLGTVIGDFDIDPASKAQSGIGIALSGQAFRRVRLVADGRQVLVRLSGLANLYGKSRFNDLAVDVAAGPELQVGSSSINVEAGATQRWFGQKPFMRSARLGATMVRPLGRLSQLRMQGTAALVDNQVNDLEDGKTYFGAVSFEHALSPTTGVALSLSAAREALRDQGYSTRGWRLNLLGWHDIGRLTLTAEAQVGRLVADQRLSLFPDKRRDQYSRLSVGATFRRFGFAGFAPVARIVFERNKSSIAFYDFERTRTEFGIERAF
jgi:hypothetical protein